jgi:acyl carrier protein phosphodiesterase
MFDTSIAVWNAKRYWDSERQVTAIATLARMFHGYMFHDDWQPYLLTPPFPDFVSSHSAISASAAEVLRRFTGSEATVQHKNEENELKKKENTYRSSGGAKSL